MHPGTMLLAGHLIGLVLGLGGVVVLDTCMLRFLKGAQVAASDCDLVHHVSRLVIAGLLVLWVTGVAFLLCDSPLDGPLLANPKVHAKLVIVGVRAAPLAGPAPACAPGRALAVRGAGLASAHASLRLRRVSTVSWYMAFLLGMVRESNGILPMSHPTMSHLPGVYGLLLLGALAAAGLIAGPSGAAREGRQGGPP